MIHNSQGLINM